VDHYIHLVPKLRMSGDTPPLPLSALMTCVGTKLTLTFFYFSLKHEVQLRFSCYSTVFQLYKEAKAPLAL
jgi:hypothetical protein